MRQSYYILAILCGLCAAGVAGAAENPKLKPVISEARHAGLNHGTLKIYLSQANGAGFSLDLTEYILKEAIAVQKAGAPGDQILLKANEGVAKRVVAGGVKRAVHKLAKDWLKAANEVPKNLSASARKKAILEKYREAHPTRSTAER